jgi:hypothetical protein
MAHASKQVRPNSFEQQIGSSRTILAQGRCVVSAFIATAFGQDDTEAASA